LAEDVDPLSFMGHDGNITTLDPVDTAVLTLSAPEALVAAALDSISAAQVAVHLAWRHCGLAN
jgi:hypothetical protein